MQRPFIILCVLAPLLIGPAVAQNAPSGPSELEQSGLTPPTMLSQGYSASTQDLLVSMLLGDAVFTSAEPDAEMIGAISDMVITPGQGISAVIIGVGGFLGIGDKDVAIDFSQLQWSELPDGAHRWVLETTPEALEAAPAFIWSDSEEETDGAALSPAEEEAQLVEGDPNDVPVDPDLTTDQPNQPAEGDTPIASANLSPEQLRGIGVYGTNDAQIGTISDVVMLGDDIDALVIDVGGFLGIGAKPVAVGLDNLTLSSDIGGARYLFLNATREELENQPAYDPTTYESERALQRMVIAP